MAQSTVIVCHRDLRDIAVSCRQTDFITLEWASNWEHLARRFADHLQISDHWNRTRPVEWLDVRYEDLVAALAQRPPADRISRPRLGTGVPRIRASRRVVRTASMVQVRQPIHSGSVGHGRTMRRRWCPSIEHWSDSESTWLERAEQVTRSAAV